MGSSRGEAGAQRPELIDDPKLLHAVLEHAGLAVIVLNAAGQICVFNRECERLSGLTAAEVTGRSVFETVLPPDDVEEIRSVFHALAAGDFPNEYENNWLHKCGQLRRIHWHNTILTDAQGRITYIVALGIDVSETQQAKAVLRARQEQLQRLENAFPALVGQLDTKFNLVFANEQYRRWFGLNPERIIGRPVVEIIGEEAFAVLKPHYETALAGGTSVYHGVVPYQHGGHRSIHGVYVPHIGSDGAVDGVYILSVDITEQEFLASALSYEAKRSSSILAAALDSVIMIGEDGIIRSANPSVERMFGYTSDEVIGRNISVLMPSPHREHHDEYINRYLKTGERRMIGIGRELQARRKDGSIFPVYISIGEFELDGKQYFTGFICDISSRKHAEAEARERLDQLAHVARVGAMSDMASGLAHEVNQPLAAIIATAQACLRLMKEARSKPEVLQRSLEQIIRQGERASNVIYEMRQFLRRADDLKREPQDINSLVRRIVELIEHERAQLSANIILQLSDEPVVGEVNAVQIEQVLLNLLRNALEAAQAVGRQPRVVITTRNNNGIVEMSFEDNGPGVPEEMRSRLFEPFFTTKSSGMGQGLSISRSLVRAHDGDIRLLSTSPEGCCFQVELPAAEGAVT